MLYVTYERMNQESRLYRFGGNHPTLTKIMMGCGALATLGVLSYGVWTLHRTQQYIQKTHAKIARVDSKNERIQSDIARRKAELLDAASKEGAKIAPVSRDGPPFNIPEHESGAYLCKHGHWTVFDLYMFERKGSVPEDWERAHDLDFNKDGRADPTRVIDGRVQVEDRVHARWYTIGKLDHADGATYKIRFLGNINDRFGTDAPQVIVQADHDGVKSYDVFEPVLN
jgi:hypothetical protein